MNNQLSADLFLKVKERIFLIVTKNFPNPTLSIITTKKSINFNLDCTNRKRALRGVKVRGRPCKRRSNTTWTATNVCYNRGNIPNTFSPTKQIDNEKVQSMRNH